MDLSQIERTLAARISEVASTDDPAHDLLHFKRVVKVAKKLCAEEGAKPEVVVPAAWLHDLVLVPKDDPRRAHASRLSADAATKYLREIGYPEIHLDEIAHAIAAHSFSARIEPETPEARVVQDADRLDGLGAIGIARCFATAALMKRPFYREDDPFCARLEPDDRRFTVDHFYAKLFRTAETMRTASGRAEGARRVTIMKNYLDALALEIE